MKQWIARFVVVGCIMWTLPAWGEDQNVNKDLHKMGAVVVSATKVEGYQHETGSSVTVITADDLAKKGKKGLLEALRDVPGLSIIQSGTIGGTADIFIRGTKPGHTLVMLDGIELSDSMKADRSVELAHLFVDNIERVEIVRGAQSPLYGSDAMGGVINIITKKGEGKTKVHAAFEAGSHNTFTEKAGINGSAKKMNYSISALRIDTDGISKATGGAEDDGYANNTFSMRLGFGLFKDANLDVVFRYTDAKYDYDDRGNEDDPNKVGWEDKLSGKIAFDQAVNTFWGHKITFAYSKTEREYRDEVDAVDTDPTFEDTHNWVAGDTKKVEWQHVVCPVEWAQLTAGVEYEEEKGSGDGNRSWYVFEEKAVDNKAGYLQSQFKFFGSLFITPGIRVDDNELFGSEVTYKISVSHLINKTGTRLKANWGTGFKAPTLYQLYSSYGDPNLKPEEGETYDIGFEQHLFGDKVIFSLTYFNNDFENMVDYDFDTSSYQNIDNAEMEGWELEGSFNPMETLTLRANYTYTSTKDRDSGNELRRRPENQAALCLNWAFIEKANLNLSASYVGSRWDNSANTRRADSYTTVDLSTYYDVTENFQIFARIENLFDESHEQVNGYAGADASYYAGIKAAF